MGGFMKRVGLYARVSTLDGQTTETQLRELRVFAERKGFQVVREYVDEGVSGVKQSRPALDELMRDARMGLLDVVVVWRFDRFSRSVLHLVQSLEEFRALQVDFVSLSEAIDTSTPMGRMIFTITGAFAEFERNVIRERVVAGMGRARAEGKHLGRPRRIFDRDRAKELKASGMSLRQIAEELGVGKDTVRAAL